MSNRTEVLKEREPISNIRGNYEINPYLKQLKNFENRMRHPRNRNKLTEMLRPLRPRDRWENNTEAIKLTKEMLSRGGLTMDFLQEKENKFQEIFEEENEDKARQQELIDKVRNIRALSRDFARISDKE